MRSIKCVQYQMLTVIKYLHIKYLQYQMFTVIKYLQYQIFTVSNIYSFKNDSFFTCLVHQML